jgi:hypothetical protein
MNRFRVRHFGAMRFLLLGAFLLQSLFVQAHVHAASAAEPVTIAAQTGTTGETSKDESTGTSPYCFLCWEAAMAGQFVQPTAYFVLPQALPEQWEAPQAAIAFALGKFAHGWLSRAPPQ